MTDLPMLSRPWSDEESISLNYIHSTLPNHYLQQAGHVEFLDKFSQWPERTLRLEAVHQTLISLYRQDISPRNAAILVKSVPELVKLGIYDIHIEEFLEGSRVFPAQYRSFRPYDNFFDGYCAPPNLKNAILLLSVATFVRQFSFIFNGELKSPLAGSPLFSAISRIFDLLSKTQHEKHERALTQILNLSTDISSLAIVSGKALVKEDLQALRRYIRWIANLESPEDLAQYIEALVLMRAEVTVQMKAVKLSGLEILWKDSLIKF